jgi:5,10-methylenetetrahydrofolate reductase
MPLVSTPHSSVLERLREDRPLAAVELRPPRTGLSSAESMEVWIDMYHSIRRLARRDTVIFLTDNAVGLSEEENLAHLTANLAGDVDPRKIVPFLTSKHSIEYCLMHASRTASHGFEALTVLGGDHTAGPPRCVPHARELRALIRRRVPRLNLGGWANPLRSTEEQLNYLMDERFEADFFLTQIVSHHNVREVERFVTESRRRGVPYPGVFGVFLYRSANPATLKRLSEFFPVPAAELTREFDAGMTPEEICAKTVRTLREVGADKVYLSNLGFQQVEARYRRILEHIEQ